MRDAQRKRAGAGCVACRVQLLQPLDDFQRGGKLEVVGACLEQNVCVAALLKQPAQPKVALIADIDVVFAVETLEHLLRRPAAHSDVIHAHAKPVSQLRRPRCKRARVLGERSEAGSKRVAVA